MAEEGSDPLPDQRVSILLSVVCHPEPATLRRGRVEGSRVRFFCGRDLERAGKLPESRRRKNGGARSFGFAQDDGKNSWNNGQNDPYYQQSRPGGGTGARRLS